MLFRLASGQRVLFVANGSVIAIDKRFYPPGNEYILFLSNKNQFFDNDARSRMHGF